MAFSITAVPPTFENRYIRRVELTAALKISKAAFFTFLFSRPKDFLQGVDGFLLTFVIDPYDHLS